MSGMGLRVCAKKLSLSTYEPLEECHILFVQIFWFFLQRVKVARKLIRLRTILRKIFDKMFLTLRR